MYFFWWDKPLGVNEPVKLYRRGKGPTEILIGEEGSKQDVSIEYCHFVKCSQHLLDIQRRKQRIEDSSKRSLVQKLMDIVSPIQPLLKGCCMAFASCCTQIYRQLSSISAFDINQFLKVQRDKLHKHIPFVYYLWFLYLPIYWFVWIPVKALTVALLAIADTEHLEFHSTTYVPTFYAPTLSLDFEALFFFVLPPTAIVFGALHCIGWNFHFPSHVEQLLWRIGSLTITLLPTILLLLPTLFYINDIIKKLCGIYSGPLIPYSVQDILTVIGIFFGGASLIAYMAARLLLLTLAVVLLRRQPESAFHAINWANFLPHI